MTAPKMTRVAVRVPHTTLEQINEWVDALGVRRSHFLGIALVAGVRSLMRASAFELALPAKTDEPDLQEDQGEETEAPQGAFHTAEWEVLLAQIAQLEAQVARLQAKVASLTDQVAQQP